MWSNRAVQRCKDVGGRQIAARVSESRVVDHLQAITPDITRHYRGGIGTLHDYAKMKLDATIAVGFRQANPMTRTHDP